MRPSRTLGIVVLLLAGFSGCAGSNARTKWSSAPPDEVKPSMTSRWFGTRWWSRPTPTSVSTESQGALAPRAEERLARAARKRTSGLIERPPLDCPTSSRCSAGRTPRRKRSVARGTDRDLPADDDLGEARQGADRDVQPAGGQRSSSRDPPGATREGHEGPAALPHADRRESSRPSSTIVPSPRATSPSGLALRPAARHGTGRGRRRSPGRTRSGARRQTSPTTRRSPPPGRRPGRPLNPTRKPRRPRSVRSRIGSRPRTCPAPDRSAREAVPPRSAQPPGRRAGRPRQAVDPSPQPETTKPQPAAPARPAEETPEPAEPTPRAQPGPHPPPPRHRPLGRRHRSPAPPAPAPNHPRRRLFQSTQPRTA